MLANLIFWLSKQTITALQVIIGSTITFICAVLISSAIARDLKAHHEVHRVSDLYADITITGNKVTGFFVKYF